jgi:DNA-binding NtrC family response regulator
MTNNVSMMPSGSSTGNAPSQSSTQKKKRILIVEDERDIADAIKAALKSDYWVDNGGTAFQAIRSYRPKFYDLIILDYRMPNMDGFAFYQQVKNIDPQVKICFITAYEEFHSKILNMKWKINLNSIFQEDHELPVLKKPFDTAALKTMVLQLIGS